MKSRCVFVLAGLIASAFAIPAVAQNGKGAPEPKGAVQAEQESRLNPIPVQLERLDRLRITTRGRVLEDTQGGLRGPCPPTLASNTDANFSGGSFVVQAGFSEQEMAAATYTLPASAFPIKIDLMEFILATSNASVQTTTKWGVRVWDGPPNTGTLVASYDSDDVILPYARVGPGTAGVNIQVSVDPGDPEQIFVTNANGTNSFTIALIINDHHNQTANPCNTAPPSSSNAFPTTDTGGLQNPTKNWLYGLNCGAFGCPANGGWATFQALNFLCRPSGDWVMRATWTSLNCTPATGACCVSGVCSVSTQAQCTGTYQGDNTNCTSNPCPQPTGACCFSNNNCVVLSSADCSTVAGTWLGAGAACSGTQCPSGACCLPSGSCVTTTIIGCGTLGGTFRGAGTNCASANCPQPQGACCVGGGSCLIQTQANCNLIPGGTWRGAGTTCTACTCPADRDHNGTIEPADIALFVNQWLQDLQNGTRVADFDNNNAVEPADIAGFVNAWLQGLQTGCP